MKARRARTEPGDDRRRNLAETNLLSDQRPEQKPARTIGCSLPFLGALFVALLPLAIWLR